MSLGEKPKRNRVIVLLHRDGKTLTEVAEWAGISRERVRQIVRRAGVPVEVTKRNKREAQRGPQVERVEFTCKGCGKVEKRVPHRARSRMFCSRECYMDWITLSGDELIGHLQDLGDRLGRTPGFHDIQAADGPSVFSYYKHFGSLRRAQKLSGFEPNPVGYHGHRS